MRKPSHTPGPWTTSERDGSYVSINADSWDMLATVVVRMEGADENTPSGEANARLIAAAPDLLKACKEAAAIVPMGSIVLKQLLAAITKASGEA